MCAHGATVTGRWKTYINRRRPFDPALQDHNGKYAWYAGMRPGQEHGKLTALDDDQYTFACSSTGSAVSRGEKERCDTGTWVAEPLLS